MQPRSSPRYQRWVLALSLGIALLYLFPRLFEFSLRTGHSKMFPSILAGLIGCPRLLWQVAAFFGVLFGLHALAGLGSFRLMEPLLRRVCGERRATQAALMGVVGFWFWLLLANSVLYPASAAAFWNRTDTGQTALRILFAMVSALLTLALGGGLVLRIRGAYRRWPRVTALTAAALAAGVVLATVRDRWAAAGRPAVERDQPDLIFIGVDSVRTDHVGYYNRLQPSLTPTLDGLLEQGAVFYNAWTVLARTYPAWLSILTGQYPATHGGVFNLMPPERVRYANNLAHQLGAAGYQRIYAIDETRFSNLDMNYGFDHFVAPPMGAFDFLLESMADSPMVNLVANTPPGRWLFPYLYMNRAFPVIYRPEIFDANVARAIRSLDRRRPMFLVAHYELPHWPYTWAGSQKYRFQGAPELDSLSPEAYRKTVARVDQQVAALWQVLKSAGRLDNAVLIVLSDHGEAFDQSEPPWIWRGEGAAPGAPPRQGGHGSSVVSEHQNRIILGFAGFGPQAGSIEPGLNTEATVSLVDIRPTLETWLDLPAIPGHVREGRSLMATLQGQTDSGWSDRVVLTETGFSLPAIIGGSQDMAEIFDIGMKYYRVLPNGRLAIDDQWLPLLTSRKQYGAIHGRWALGQFPQGVDDQSEAQLWLVDMTTREFWHPDQKETLPPDAPVDRLLNAIHESQR